MAEKKTKTAPAAPAGEATPKAERGSNDTFTFIPENKRTEEQKAVKLAPQARDILTVLADLKSAKRPELVNALKGVLKTRQPEGRILSYYQKTLVAAGAVTIS